MDYNARILAHKYAKAFYGASLCKISFEHYTQLQAFHQVLCSNKALMTIISAPLLDKTTRQNYVRWLVHHYKLCDSILSLIELLFAHQRIILFVMVLDKCLQLYENYHQLERFEITSAVPLHENDYIVIEKFLSTHLKKRIISTRIIDSTNLIAGIKMKSMTYYLNYSLGKKLHSVRNMLLTQGITWK